MRRATYALLSLVVVFGLVQCGGGDDGPTPPDNGPDPNQAPSVTITSPDDGATFDIGAQVTLEGSADDPEDGALSGSSLTWSSDVDGQLGTGTSVTVSSLSEGTHEITLEAEDSAGATATASIAVVIGSQASGGVVEMRIEDNVFIDPLGRENTNASVTINLGESVLWTYTSDGNSVHTVTFGEGTGGSAGDGVPEGGTAENSDNLTPGDSFQFTPDAVGTWTYYCEVHPGIMYESTIVVNP